MRWLLLPVILGAACGGETEPPPVGPITLAVTHYDYQFEVESRAARSILTATVEVEGDCLTLPVRAELDPGSVLIDGATARSVAIAGGSLTACGPGHRAGEALVLETRQTVAMETLSTSQVGYSITQDSDTNRFYYLVSWVGGCDRFGPCDNRPDRFARYTFRVTHPEGFRARCAGTVTDVSATETRCDFDHDGGPTYSTFGIAVYPRWSETDKGTWGSVQVTVHDRPQTTIDGAIDATYHAGFVEFLESTFGPYPYGDELRILTAPTYWSGFEHPGNIVLDDRLNLDRSSYRRPVQHVLDHEIAHQWAGDQTTLADTYDFVWKEAMAEYLTYVYEDMADPLSASATLSAWKSFSIGARYFPVPEDRPELFEYYGDVYGPGPLILFRQLEVLASRQAVIAALQTVLGSQRALSVDELVDALEAATGLDLAGYVAGWIRGSGRPDWPTMAVTFTPGAETSTLAVRQTNPSQRTCKFHVALVGANPGEVVEVAVDTFRDGIDQTLTIPTPAFEVTRTDLDPRRECLVFPAFMGVHAEPPRAHPWARDRGHTVTHTF
jgi:aminopeptidase N